MATKKEQRQHKQFVEKLLMIQGIKYDDWLHDVHDQYIQENNKVILEALDTTLNKKKNKENKGKDTFKNNENQNNYNRQGGNK